jgi:hypothetical protein
MKTKSDLFNNYRVLTSLQSKHNLVIPWSIEKFVGKTLRYFCSVALLTRRTSKHHHELINSISTNLIESNVNSILSSESSSLYSSLSLTSSNRCLSDYQVIVLDSKWCNAKAWIGGGITIDDSLIDSITKEYYKDIISSTNVTIEALESFESHNNKKKEEEKGSVIVDLSSVEIDDILACILAHEMSHIAKGHLSISLTFYIVSTILLGGIPQVNNNSDNIVVPFLLLLNRLHEHDADCNGLLLAYNAGYNPLGDYYLSLTSIISSSTILRYIHYYCNRDVMDGRNDVSSREYRIKHHDRLWIVCNPSM